MKKQRNFFQLEEQNSPERTNNETDLSSLLDLKFKKEVIKILKELRKIISKNADHCKRTRNYKHESIEIRQFNC